MSATDYRSGHPAASYEKPSAIEALAAEQLAQADLALGPIDLSYDVAMDELPD